MTILPGVIRRCRKAANRLGLADDGSRRAAAAVQKVLETQGRELFLRAGVPGMAVHVQFASGPDARLYLGQRDPATSQPMDAATVFQVLSMTKPLTAMCVLLLARQGLLTLDTPINSMLRSWQLPSAEPRNPLLDPGQVTVRSILCHSGGLSVPRHPWTTHDDVRWARETLSHPDPALRIEIVEQPRTGLRYSGGGYVVLQGLIEEVTGKHFSQVARELVLEPLGLAQSDVLLSDRALSKLAARHDKDNRPLPVGRTIAPGSSGLACTAEDLARLWGSVLDRREGDPHRPRVLTDAEAREMTLPQITAPDGRMCGHGFFLWRRRTDTEFFHSGYSDGCWGHAEGLRARRVVFVILTNGDRGGACVKPLATLVRQTLYDVAI